MAKALYGHLGPDPRASLELAQMRRRIRDLEDEVARLQAANSALTELVTEDRLVELDRREIETREPAFS